MKTNNKINNLNKNKNFHLVVSETNYYKLKSLGKMGDTFDKVLGELLESYSIAGKREKTLISSQTPIFKGGDMQ